MECISMILGRCLWWRKEPRQDFSLHSCFVCCKWHHQPLPGQHTSQHPLQPAMLVRFNGSGGRRDRGQPYPCFDSFGGPFRQQCQNHRLLRYVTKLHSWALVVFLLLICFQKTRPRMALRRVIYFLKESEKWETGELIELIIKLKRYFYLPSFLSSFFHHLSIIFIFP